MIAGLSIGAAGGIRAARSVIAHTLADAVEQIMIAAMMLMIFMLSLPLVTKPASLPNHAVPTLGTIQLLGIGDRASGAPTPLLPH